VICASQQVPSDSKEILNDTVQREKALRLAGRFETTHVPLSLPGWLMREFGTIVRVALSVVADVTHHRFQGCRIAIELVGTIRNGSLP